MSSFKNTISKNNDTVISFLENPVVKYCSLIFITILIIFIEKIKIEYLEVFDLDMFKIIYALLIAYTACFDPIYAIILTTFMIMSIQELHTRRANNAIYNHKSNVMTTHANAMTTHANVMTTHANVNSNMNKKVKPSFIASKVSENQQTTQSVIYDEIPNKDILVNDKIVYDLINKHSLQKTPNVDDTLIGEYDYYEDPAFKTITNNLKDKNLINKNQFFITDDDLVNAQINTQEGVDQNTSMKAFTSNILNIQGLPNGYDPKSSYMNLL